VSSMGAYLEAELARLDLLLRREILRLRARYQLSLDEFRGLYVSDRQVDALVAESAARAGTSDALCAEAEVMRTRNAGRWPPEWERAVREFGLTAFDLDVLLVALAPELHLKYATIYAYLHDDVTRKKPTGELALRLSPMADRSRLLPESPLFREGLLREPAEQQFLGCELSASLPALRVLTGLPGESAVPETPWPEGADRGMFERAASMRGLFVVECSDSDLARRMVEAACTAEGRPLLVVDARREGSKGLGRRIRLAQRLEGCVVYVTGSDALWGAEPAPGAELASPAAALFVLATGSRWRGALPAGEVRVLKLPEPDVAQRRALWNRSLPEAEAPMIDALAARYTLDGSQIVAASCAARDALRLRGEARVVEWRDLVEAVHGVSDSTIGLLAQPVKCPYGWHDLVLPPATLRQVREVAAAMRFHHVVCGEWGFAARHSGVEGLKFLFAGSSGTGKTMTAGVIGNDLGMDVYRIDLSGVVSKYIGETEKNLDRVFAAARRSNALLFFDEADALFGKRSEVKEAHDRYANIEVAYLLQKLEEHDGPVILATNLRRNIDEAFSRRMQYVVEFPLPDETQRRQMWEKVFPRETPIGEDVDYPFLAAQFAVTGGDIRNIAMDAAFLAAQDGGVVAMRHLAAAMARQVVKQGRAPSATMFQRYYQWVKEL